MPSLHPRLHGKEQKTVGAPLPSSNSAGRAPSKQRKRFPLEHLDELDKPGARAIIRRTYPNQKSPAVKESPRWGSASPFPRFDRRPREKLPLR
ncbi:protein of unknown function [Candidatus Methylocalor cossyra]|uniref:Uncharacterized protein n=1 Tax=Candidatus Methylocalor cossyra TaxID=3108543 RepID=A0ABM9NGR6_9GAMM